MSRQFQGYEDSRLRKVAKVANSIGGEILDMGYAQMPNPYFSGVRRVGLDLALPKSASGYEEELVGDATRLKDTLGDRKFDCIIAGELIEHLENPYAFLRNVKDSLAPGATLVVTTPNPVSWPVLPLEWFRARKFFYTDEHLYYFAPRWVVRMLEHTGFEVTEVSGVGLLLPILPFALPCPANVSYQVIYQAKVRQ
jgi:2-polyprenyl-3-methyl-5-hydroxy-6-metoxy-1,4-benzoquinol methylase